jgi:hypothetical protein
MKLFPEPTHLKSLGVEESNIEEKKRGAPIHRFKRCKGTESLKDYDLGRPIWVRGR